MSTDTAKKQGYLSNKDLRSRWGNVDRRTVQRHRKEFGLEPVDFTGNNPVFRLEDVEAMEERRRQKRIEVLNNSKRGEKGILTLKQLRRRVGKRRAGK